MTTNQQCIGLMTRKEAETTFDATQRAQQRIVARLRQLKRMRTRLSPAVKAAEEIELWADLETLKQLLAKIGVSFHIGGY